MIAKYDFFEYDYFRGEIIIFHTFRSSMIQRHYLMSILNASELDKHSHVRCENCGAIFKTEEIKFGYMNTLINKVQL